VSTAINELPPTQQEILIILRRQKVSADRIAVTLRVNGIECDNPMTHLQALVEPEFLTYEALAEGAHWFLTDKGKVAAELLWFDKRFDDPSKLFGALGR
jgi:predicted ArsR family transcriptional regulator